MEVQVKKHWKLAVAAFAVLVAVMTAAVGAKVAPAVNARSTACGGIVNAPPNDPNNLLPALNLSKPQQHFYTGWNHPITASAWANWQPSHKPPYHVAIVWSATGNVFNSYALNLIQKFLKRSPLVDKTIPVTIASSPTAIAEQLQAYNAAVQAKPDLIILSPLAPPAIQSYVEAAGQQGIPTISVFNPIDTPYDVTVTRNTYVDSTTVAAQMVKALGGQGNILEVLGTPSAATTTDEQNQWRTVLNSCPGINIVGPAIGFFSTALAKTAVLQWLSTHPDKVDGVIETAAMAQGVLQAFQQAGRPVPIIGQIQAEKSVTGYWLQNVAKGYHGAAVVGGGTDYASLVSRVALRMLAGQGPKINTVVWPLTPISDKGVQVFAKKYWPGASSWTADTPGSQDNPKPFWYTDKDLDKLFNHPERTQGTKF
jgi:ribose transport system substrate-binding protein